MTPGEESTPELDQRREQIRQYYKDTVPRPELYRDPHRGLYGMAYIPLKDDAIPYRAKPFSMHGERGEAYKKVVMDE